MTARRILSFIAALALFFGGVLLYCYPRILPYEDFTLILWIALGLFSAGGYWLWFCFVLPSFTRSMTGRIVVIALSAVLTLFPVAIAILYVLGETYGQWVTGLGRDANGIFAVHDGPGGIPMILFTFLSWALLGLLLIGVIARTIWLLSHHQKPGFLLTSWLSMLIL